MSCTILCKLLDELAENTPRAQVKMSGRAGLGSDSDVLCHILQGGAWAADSADCCMICLVWPAQTAGSVHTSRQSSPQQLCRPVIGPQLLIPRSDWLLRSLPAPLVWICTVPS